MTKTTPIIIIIAIFLNACSLQIHGSKCEKPKITRIGNYTKNSKSNIIRHIDDSEYNKYDIIAQYEYSKIIPIKLYFNRTLIDFINREVEQSKMAARSLGGDALYMHGYKKESGSVYIEPKIEKGKIFFKFDVLKHRFMTHK